MRSLAAPVSFTRVTSFKEQLNQARIALNKKVMKVSPVLAFSKSLPTPLLTCTFQKEWHRVPQFTSLEMPTESVVASTPVASCLQSPPTSSYRRSSPGLKGLSAAPRAGGADAAAMADEICAIEDIKEQRRKDTL